MHLNPTAFGDVFKDNHWERLVDSKLPPSLVPCQPSYLISSLAQNVCIVSSSACSLTDPKVKSRLGHSARWYSDLNMCVCVVYLWVIPLHSFLKTVSESLSFARLAVHRC